MRVINHAWAEAARTLELSFQPGSGTSRSPLISGELKGSQVTVTLGSRLSGDEQQQVTKLEVSFIQPLGLGLQLSPEDLISSLNKLIGGQDIQVGSEQFDRDVLIRGRDPERVRGFLTRARRLRIHRLLMSVPGCVIDDRGIRATLPERVDDPFKLASILRRMSHLAWFLCEERKEEDRPVEAAIEALAGGDLAEAIQVLQPAELPTLSPPPPEASSAPPTPPRPLEERVLEGEVRYLAGDREGAARVLEQAAREAPDDEELQQWAELTAAPAPPIAEQREAVPLDVVAVCDDLFAGGATSSQISQRFEQRYLEQAVCWRGVLERADRFTYDLLFGREPGTKALLQIHEVEAGLYGTKQVRAVVSLPEEALTGLQEQRGETLGFEGRLVKCDPFMRNLYLAEGRLL